MRVAIGLWLILTLGVAGCTGGHRSGGGPLAATSATASPTTLEDLAAGQRDCLQYPVAKFADGTEDWNADYVFFTLVGTKDGKVVCDPKGQPLATGLLAGRAVRFMKDHPEMAATTSWCYAVKRMKRHLRNGQVLSQSDYVTLDDVDLAELVAKDKQARTQ